MLDVELPTVLDPACGEATLLAAVADRFGDHVELLGQELDEHAADLGRQKLRDHPLNPPYAILNGDSLRSARLPEGRGRVDAVVCVVPRTANRWPAAELAADPRWRFGTPDPADGELAWVQHAVAMLREHGQAVVAVSPLTATRPSGRLVRAALVRSGVLRAVVALPSGLGPADSVPGAEQAAESMHVWVLRRDGHPPATVRMIDLTGVADPADVPRDAQPVAGAAGLLDHTGGALRAADGSPRRRHRPDPVAIPRRRRAGRRGGAGAGDRAAPRAVRGRRRGIAPPGRGVRVPAAGVGDARRAGTQRGADDPVARGHPPRRRPAVPHARARPGGRHRHSRRRPRRRPGGRDRPGPARPALRRAVRPRRRPLRSRRQHSRRPVARRPAPLPDTPAAVARPTGVRRRVPAARRHEGRAARPGHRGRAGAGPEHPRPRHRCPGSRRFRTERDHRCRLPVPRPSPHPDDEKSTN